MIGKKEVFDDECVNKWSQMAGVDEYKPDREEELGYPFVSGHLWKISIKDNDVYVTTKTRDITTVAKELSPHLSTLASTLTYVGVFSGDANIRSLRSDDVKSVTTENKNSISDEERLKLLSCVKEEHDKLKSYYEKSAIENSDVTTQEAKQQ